MEYNRVKTAIRNIVKGIIETDVDDNDNLYDSGLDSLGVVRLLVAIEDELKLYIAITELERETFSTIEQITNHVWDRLQQA